MRGFWRVVWCHLVHSWDWQNPRWREDYQALLYRCPYCRCERQAMVWR